MMENPKISVIVPVYNAEKTLRRCVDSILGQTFSNFELLLIDDGSSDRSGAICDEYAASNYRVRILHKTNGGVSSARNLGLDNAVGEWICFIDSDDWVERHFFEHFMQYATDKCALLLNGEVRHFADGRMDIIENDLAIADSTNFEDVYCKCNLNWRTSPWGKLFKHELIKRFRLRFDEKMGIGEDALFLYSYLLLTQSLIVIPFHDYNYSYETEGSLTKKVYDINTELYIKGRIIEATFKLQNRFNLSSESSISRINWIYAYYTGRVINSLYHTNGIRRKRRLNILKTLDINHYVSSLEARTLKEYILFFLLRNKQLWIYDVIRFLNKKLK